MGLTLGQADACPAAQLCSFGLKSQRKVCSEETHGGPLGSRRCFERGVDTCESPAAGICQAVQTGRGALENPLSLCRCVPQGLKGSSDALLISDRVLERYNGQFILSVPVLKRCVGCVSGAAPPGRCIQVESEWSSCSWFLTTQKHLANSSVTSLVLDRRWFEQVKKIQLEKHWFDITNTLESSVAPWNWGLDLGGGKICFPSINKTCFSDLFPLCVTRIIISKYWMRVGG